MIRAGEDAQKDVAIAIADLMMSAAKTAPKGSGADKIIAITLTGKDKDALTDKMRERGKELGHDFFIRDAGNIDDSYCIVLLGAIDVPLALDNCGMCGFPNCGESKKAGAHCAFNVTDLGIAVGSAVSIAADNRLDNRIMYSAGRVATEMGLFDGNVTIAFGIPLFASSKSIFFDRAPGSVLV